MCGVKFTSVEKANSVRAFWRQAVEERDETEVGAVCKATRECRLSGLEVPL